MIHRDPRGATAERYDLIVVGGGVYGIALTLEAGRRGLRPLLLERADFGQHTSWNSLRILHGGLRYLQTADLRRFFESVRERRWFLTHFPTLVQPLPCTMPLYDRGLKRRSVLKHALRLNDSLCRSRIAGLSTAGILPDSRVLSPSETIERFPEVRRAQLKGAALWFDAVMPNSHRLLIEMLRWACRSGAVALNYVKAEELLTSSNRVEGVRARDRESGGHLDYRAPVVVNCAGPWVRSLARQFDRELPHLFRPSLAFNLLLDRAPPFATAVAVAPPSPGSSTYFLHPWKGRILAGTYHAPWSKGPDDGGPPESYLQQCLADLRAAIPDLDLHRDHVLRVYWGLLPAAAHGTARLATREVIHNHGRQSGPVGFYSVSGIKFTTARLVAEKALKQIYHGALAKPEPVEAPTPANIPDAVEFESLLDSAPQQAQTIVRRLVREEAVVSVEDLLHRRTDWGTFPDRGRRLASRVDDLLASCPLAPIRTAAAEAATPPR